MDLAAAFVCIGSVNLVNSTNHGVNIFQDTINTKPVVIIFHPTAASLSNVKSPCVQMKAIKYGSVPVQINFPGDESR
jgi:hypothetical protein